MLSEATIKTIKKGTERQAKEMIKKVKKINKLGGVAEFSDRTRNSVILIKCPKCKKRQSDFRIKVPTGGCEYCDF